MPRTIDEGFRDFLKQLTPSPVESQKATSHRASIESCLKNTFGITRFARIGSFGNGTSISGYSDVDYLASLPNKELAQDSAYSLTKVRNALDARFPLTGVRVNTPAVTVPFGSVRSETTEVVPAEYLRTSNGFLVYDIADGAGAWMEVSPDAHNAYVATEDQRLGLKVKPLVRFLKAWKYFQQVPVSSFYLEMRAAKYAASENAIVYDIDLDCFFAHLESNGLASLRDPMGVSGLISACKSEVQRKEALSKLSTAATRSQKAYDARSRGNVEDAFYWWRLLFGERFPSYYR